MSWFDKIIRPGARKESATTRAIVAWLLGQAVWMPTDYAGYVREGYRQNPYVYACIRQVAWACAGIPLRAYQRGGDDDDERTALPRKHPLVRLLHQPNPECGRAKLIENLVAFLLLSGDTFLELAGPIDKPKELYVLRPDRMRILPGDQAQRVRGYEYEVNGIKVPFDAERVMHIWFFNPDNDWYGQSPMQAAARSIDQSNYSKSWNVALLQNSARPSGAFVSKGFLTDGQYDRLRDEAEANYAGSINAGRPMVLEGDLSWQEMGINPKDMEWLAGQKLSAREVAITFGVPPELIGDSANKTYNNYREARQAFYLETILPLMDWLVDELNNWFTPRYGDDIELGYDRSEIEALQEEQSKRWDRAVSGRSAGILTTDEARREVGLKPKGGEEGEAILVSSTMVPLERALNPPEPAAPPGGGGTNEGPPPGKTGPGEAQAGAPQAKAADPRSIRGTEDPLKLSYWMAVEHRRERWYKEVGDQVRAELELERQQLVERLRSAGAVMWAEKVVDDVLDPAERRWLALITATTLSVAKAFAADTLARFQKAGREPEARKALDGPDLWDKWQEDVRQWIGLFGVEQARRLNGTTKINLRREILRAEESGASIDDLAKRIDTFYLDEIIPHRSEVIARTEVVRASNYGSHTMAIDLAMKTGVQLVKEWLCHVDGRERPEHAAANGQKRRIEDAYSVGGEALRWPGDSDRGSAWNVVNCRCCELYAEASSEMSADKRIPSGTNPPVWESADTMVSWLSRRFPACDFSNLASPTHGRRWGPVDIDLTGRSMRQLVRMCDKYPGLENYLRRVSIWLPRKITDTTVAQIASWDGHLELSAMYYCQVAPKAKAELTTWSILRRSTFRDADVFKVGNYFHPTGFTPETVISHELGHLVHFIWKTGDHRLVPGISAAIEGHGDGIVMREVVGWTDYMYEALRNASREWREAPVSFRGRHPLSQYALKNQGEMVAEAFQAINHLDPADWTDWMRGMARLVDRLGTNPAAWPVTTQGLNASEVPQVLVESLRSLHRQMYGVYYHNMIRATTDDVLLRNAFSVYQMFEILYGGTP